VRADGVEVAQAQHPQGRVGGAGIAEDFFDVELAAPVGVGGGGGVGFVQRQVLRLAIDGGAGAEDQGLDLAPAWPAAG
jgi:hypothetical protein